MLFFVDSSGNCYAFEDDAPSSYYAALTPCPERPSSYWNWDGTQWVLDLSRIQNAKWNAIKLDRDRRSQYGGVLVDGHWIASELGGKIAVLTYLAAGENLPEGIEHPTMDNGSLPVTNELAQDMLNAILANESALYVAMNIHKAAMLALSNPENYSFSSGWPATFSSL